MNISRYLSVRFGLNYLDVENAIEEFYESDREDREDHDNTTVRTIVSSNDNSNDNSNDSSNDSSTEDNENLAIRQKLCLEEMYDEEKREIEELKEKWETVRGFLKQYLSMEIIEFDNQSPVCLFWELLGKFKELDREGREDTPQGREGREDPQGRSFSNIKLHWICAYFYGFAKRFPEIRSCCKEYVYTIVEKMREEYGIYLGNFVGIKEVFTTPIHGIDLIGGEIQVTNVRNI